MALKKSLRIRIKPPGKAPQDRSATESASTSSPGSTLSRFMATRFAHAKLAVAAVALIVGASALAVHVTGDPGAGGPRRIVELTPGPTNAEAAPVVSFGALSEDGYSFELPPDLQDAFAEESAHPNAPASADSVSADAPPGQLRISVVDSAPTRPSAQPLPRAPIAGLTERGPLGPLPIIGRDGRTAARAYARPFTGDNRPKVAIIVGGLGFNQRNTTQAIEELPPEVTLSFVPYAGNLQSWIDRARARGHEVMLELPMEPFDPEADDTGPQTLATTLSAQQNTQRLENLLSRAAGYFGVTNYQGARFATSASATAPVAQQLRRRGLVMLTSGIGQRSALSSEAGRAGLPFAAADRILDARREADAIDEQLLNLEALALQHGTAIGAGFAYPVTMEQIATWARAIGGRGYALAPVSAVIDQRNQRRR
ncbi:MAG: divergent polysaccharide deacetylase family protein [Alphaproteobacteria bacterium]|nr:divergent polysaccharide deacetylase family protein [Alphaproteobacteria bacterium]